MLEPKPGKDLMLILARELATNASTPMFIADAEGTLVFYNEPAERILGRPFAAAGEINASDWENVFEVETLDGQPMPLDQMPSGIAFLERRASSGPVRIKSLDGKTHNLETTAFPLFKRGRDFVGVVVLFWE
jgi:PAS domain-containing protein